MGRGIMNVKCLEINILLILIVMFNLVRMGTPSSNWTLELSVPGLVYPPMVPMVPMVLSSGNLPFVATPGKLEGNLCPILLQDEKCKWDPKLMRKHCPGYCEGNPDQDHHHHPVVLSCSILVQDKKCWTNAKLMQKYCHGHCPDNPGKLNSRKTNNPKIWEIREITHGKMAKKAKKA